MQLVDSCDLLNDFTEHIQLLLNENWRGILGMAGQERLLSLRAAGVVAVILKRCQGKRNKRTIWTRELLKNRTSFGAYYQKLWCFRVQKFHSHGCHFLRGAPSIGSTPNHIS